MKQILIYKGKILAINEDNEIKLITVSGISQDTNAKVEENVLLLDSASVDTGVITLNAKFENGILTI